MGFQVSPEQLHDHDDIQTVELTGDAIDYLPFQTNGDNNTAYDQRAIDTILNFIRRDEIIIPSGIDYETDDERDREPYAMKYIELRTEHDMRHLLIVSTSYYPLEESGDEFVVKKSDVLSLRAGADNSTTTRKVRMTSTYEGDIITNYTEHFKANDDTPPVSVAYPHGLNLVNQADNGGDIERIDLLEAEQRFQKLIDVIATDYNRTYPNRSRFTTREDFNSASTH